MPTGNFTSRSAWTRLSTYIAKKIVELHVRNYKNHRYAAMQCYFVTAVAQFRLSRWFVLILRHYVVSSCPHCHYLCNCQVEWRFACQTVRELSLLRYRRQFLVIVPESLLPSPSILQLSRYFVSVIDAILSTLLSALQSQPVFTCCCCRSRCVTVAV